MSDLDDIRDRLRAAILRGTYAPRQRLIETELAEEYRASRFLVRNALIQLASDGLVELQPNRGARVREISVPEAVEITEIRQAVEGLVARRAAELITDEEIAELQAIGEGLAEAVSQGELLRYSDLNATLHSRIRDIAQHATATRIIEQLNAQLVRHQFQLSLLPGRPAVSLPEHLAIIDAVCSHDADGAERAMRTHVGGVAGTISTLDPQGRPVDQEPAW
ncbi:MAG: GntR family transcriptional regulator [Schumannella sp.]|nr:GntR family transcriptional regulator [Microbacteriaceae bacterium]